MNDIQDEIKYLLDEYLNLNDSEENRRRLACWEPEVCARDQWHGRAIEGAPGTGQGPPRYPVGGEAGVGKPTPQQNLSGERGSTATTSTGPATGFP